MHTHTATSRNFLLDCGQSWQDRASKVFLKILPHPGSAMWIQDRGRTRTFRRRQRRCRGSMLCSWRHLRLLRSCRHRKRRTLRRWRRRNMTRDCRRNTYIQRHGAPQRSLVCTRNLVGFEILGGFGCLARMGGTSRQKSQHLLRNTCQHNITHTYTCCCFQREQVRQNTNNPGESRSLLQKSCLLGTRGAQTTQAGSSGPRGTARSFQRRAGSCRFQRGRQRSHWGGLAWG